MKGFIDIRNAPTELDDNTYYVNTSAIAYFHAIDANSMEELQNGSDSTPCPRTFVVINASDFDGTQLMFKITDTPDEFAARLEAAMAL